MGTSAGAGSVLPHQGHIGAMLKVDGQGGMTMPGRRSPAWKEACLAFVWNSTGARSWHAHAEMPPPPAGRRRSSGGRSGCLSKAALLVVVALGLVALQGRLAYYSTSLPIYPRRTADSSAKSAGGSAAAGLLCLPAGSPRTLLVEVPFTAGDVPSLELSVGLWERTWPCQTPPSAGRHSRPDLVFGFNGNISEERHAAARARVQRLMRRPVLQECFAEVRLESAFLSGTDDTYDKNRLDSNWTLGPNNLFWHFLEKASTDGYRYMMQLEADTLPLRPRWLDKLVCIAAHGNPTPNPTPNPQTLKPQPQP